MGTRVITQDRLENLLRLERQISKAKKALKALAEQYEEWEAPVLAALLDTPPARVEGGALQVAVDWTSRRSPDYKAWIDREHGEGTCEKILAATTPSKTPYLVIEEV